jgi:glycine/serine hydroxymethyltransferase
MGCRSVLTNKYAEGYPVSDMDCNLSTLWSNSRSTGRQSLGPSLLTQPHSGSQANTAIYLPRLSQGHRTRQIRMAGITRHG